MSILGELRRRNVIRMAGLYLVGGWLVIQVAETLLPIFGTPDWVLKSLVLLLALGFLPTLVFSWVFELTPEGLKREKDVERSASTTEATARKLDIAVIVLLLCVGGLVLWQRMAPSAPDVAASEAPAAAVSSGEPGPATVPAGTAPATSIAVLPFVNLSADADNEYFSDGITEEILNALTRIEGLKVAGRTSSFHFKGQNEDLKKIGFALGVAHVLEGSVRRQGERVRITAQLIKVDDGFHVWSQNFDRELDDIFAVQDEISTAIAAALRSRLMGGVTGAGAAVDPATYDIYLRARQDLASRDGARIVRAMEQFADVGARAPQFDAAWSGYCKSAALVFNYTGGVFDATRMQAGHEACERALALNPANAEALVMRGFTDLLNQGRFDDALASAKAATDAAPNDAEVANFAGDIFRLAGELDDAERWERRAVELDPLFAVNHSDLAMLLLMRKRYREALESTGRAVQLDPDYWTTYDVRARAYLALGDLPAADAEIANLARIIPDIYVVAEDRARSAIAAGDVATARRHLAELQKRAAAGETMFYSIAQLQARLGDTAEAAVSLQKAIAAGDPLIYSEIEWIHPADWPDDPAIRAALAAPALAPMFTRRARYAGDRSPDLPAGSPP